MKSRPVLEQLSSLAKARYPTVDPEKLETLVEEVISKSLMDPSSDADDVIENIGKRVRRLMS